MKGGARCAEHFLSSTRYIDEYSINSCTGCFTEQNVKRCHLMLQADVAQAASHLRAAPGQQRQRRATAATGLQQPPKVSGRCMRLHRLNSPRRQALPAPARQARQLCRQGAAHGEAPLRQLVCGS